MKRPKVMKHKDIIDAKTAREKLKSNLRWALFIRKYFGKQWFPTSRENRLRCTKKYVKDRIKRASTLGYNNISVCYSENYLRGRKDYIKLISGDNGPYGIEKYEFINLMKSKGFRVTDEKFKRVGGCQILIEW